MAPIFTGSKFGFGRVEDAAAAAAGGPGITATGFDVTFNIGDKSWAIRSTTGPASVSFSSGFTSANNVEILLVGGGGAGGSNDWGAAGGGGAGGFIFVPSGSGHTIISTAGPYDIGVGVGGVYSNPNQTPSPIGSPTFFSYGASSALTAIRGGSGPYPNAPPSAPWGQPGGSGGGSQFSPGSTFGSTTQAGSGDGPPTWMFGNNGGPGGSSPDLYGGGGGGADGAGSVTSFGVGGEGKAVPTPFMPTGFPAPAISALGGIPTSSPAWRYFAGGGGGGSRLSPPNFRPGGIGGGGNGGTAGPGANNVAATIGINGRGGGGGGSAEQSGPARGANGGNGIIIVHWTNI